MNINTSAFTIERYRFKDIATVEISSVDKKTKEGEVTVCLCNFTDVYYNWAITKGKHGRFMEATANKKEISRFLLKKGQVALTKDSETRFDIGIATYIADDFEDVVLGYHCALITPDETKVVGCYLNAFLHSSMSCKYFANSASGSGQRYTLSIQTIEDMLILLPPNRRAEANRRTCLQH
jgi:restriction modification system DNA specificity domain protein